MKAPTKRGPKKCPISRTGWITERQFNKEDFFCLHATKKQWFKSAKIRVAVIRLDQLEPMAERMARAISNADANDRCSYQEMAQVALRSIGLSSPTSAAGKGEK